MGVERSAAIRNAGTKSPLKIFANISKSFIGAGVLGLPYAFKQVQTDCFYAYFFNLIPFPSLGGHCWGPACHDSDLHRQCQSHTFAHRLQIRNSDINRRDQRFPPQVIWRWEIGNIFRLCGLFCNFSSFLPNRIGIPIKFFNLIAYALKWTFLEYHTHCIN